VIDPSEPSNPVPDAPPEPPLPPPWERLRTLRWISNVLMVGGGSALVVVFCLWLLALTKRIPDFPYEYVGVGAFGAYALGRILGYVRKVSGRSGEDE
jgi:hypothetical protein